LPVEEIAARVNDRFRLLASGDRTALPRQKTLRALIDWSHDLLSEPERALFRRLAVFAGGFTLEAAEAVTPGGGIADGDVLDLLAGLVDKSLVTLDADAQRYGMLETVRQYAVERLDASGEGDAVRERHLDHYLALVEQASSCLAGADQALWLERLDRARENILAAHAWSLRAPDACERSYRLVYAIRHYWFLRGLLELGHRITVDTIANGSAATATMPRCRALWAAGQICAFMASYRDGQVFLEECLRIARANGERRVVAGALNTLALAMFGLGDTSAARTHCEEALAIGRELGDERRVAMATNALAHLHRFDGRIEAAEPLYMEALALGRKLGDREMQAVGLLNLAMVAVERSSGGKAVDLLGQVLAILAETKSGQVMQSSFEVAAGLAASRGEYERAARLGGTAERHMHATGIRRDPTDEAFLSPWLVRAREALGDRRYDSAFAEGASLSFDRSRDELQAWLAQLTGAARG
jgi:tetratricopeptide (TPR) repeat protein